MSKGVRRGMVGVVVVVVVVVKGDEVVEMKWDAVEGKVWW